MPRTRPAVQALAASIRSTLALIDAGSLSASTATTYRLQGAVVAVDSVLGGDQKDVLSSLTG